MNTSKISNTQVFWIAFSIEYAMTLFTTQSSVIQISKQDAWIAFLIGGAIACGITLLTRSLSLMYPEKTLIDFSTNIIGSWLGKILVIPFLLAWIIMSGTLLRQFSDFFQMILFDRTPSSVLMILMMIIVVGMVWSGGIEGIGRCSQLLGPLILFVTALITILSLNNFEFEQVLPLLSESGISSIIEGGMMPASALGDSFFLLMITRFMKNPQQGTKTVIWAVAAVAIICSVLTLTALSIFGPALASKMLFPTFEMMRFVSLLEFIQNIEIFSSIIWFFSVFIKLSLYLFIICYGVSQWFGLKRWGTSVWVISPVVLIIAWIVPHTVLYTFRNHFLMSVQYVILFQLFGITLLLWIIGTFRNRRLRQ